MYTAESMWTGPGGHLTGGVFVAVEDGTITASGPGDGSAHRGTGTEHVDLCGAFLTPGLHDNHTFVTGTVLEGRGTDLSGAATTDDALARWVTEDARVGGVALARGWRGAADAVVDRSAFEAATAGVPTVWFGADTGEAWRNAAARARFGDGDGFPDNESLAPVFSAAAEDPRIVVDTYRRAGRRLASAGVTSIKDVVFDDSLGVLPALEGKDLGFTVTAVVQPVRRRIDIDEVQRMRERYRAPGLRVHGVKLMTDGIVPDGTATLLDGTVDVVDWQTLLDDARAVDAAGIPLTLNADGDGAVRHSLDVFADLLADDRDRPRRWTISDASLVHPQDVVRMRALGVGVEVYLQFLQLFPSAADAFMDDLLGDRAEGFNAFRSLVDARVTVTAGTDLPLLWPDLPGSIVAAVYRRFADLGPAVGWRSAQALTVDEVLTAWTVAPSALLGDVDRPGRLAAGAPGDLVAFDRDLVVSDLQSVAAARVVRTVRAGRTVHRGG